MKIEIIDPADGIYETTEDYVHALLVTDMKQQLFVSGTMGLDENGAAPKGLDHQLEFLWQNLTRILAAAEMTVDNIVRVTSYLTSPNFVEKNQQARLKMLGNRRVPTTAIVVDTLTPDWLVEIEIIAAA